MYPPVTGLALGILGILLVTLFVIIEIGIIHAAYERLGISHRMVSILLLAMIFGSFINLPIASVSANQIVHDQVIYFWGIPYVVPRLVRAGHTEIAINVGGALIPFFTCVYVLIRTAPYLKTIIATAIVTLMVHHFATVVPGVGIAVPTLIPGIIAALAASILERRRAPAIAFIAGTLGCLIGADLMNLSQIGQMRAPVASIGGAGTFDGVFVSGLIAVLLA
ncbi:MAG TPA: DUF1614 domain-containing protein [Candidatus Binataceae bacterium]|nr:DUF1614 domain-containing protein [Candidatus Binataceae bacterium]